MPRNVTSVAVDVVAGVVLTLVGIVLSWLVGDGQDNTTLVGICIFLAGITILVCSFVRHLHYKYFA